MKRQTSKKLTRREMLKLSGAVAAGSLLAACAPAVAPIPQVVKETVPVTVVVKETVPPAPPVKETVVVEKKVEVPVALQKAMGYISHNPEKCAGCHTCMTVCSLYHEGQVNPELSRIHIVESKTNIFDVKGYTCKQCEGPECLSACPTKALHIDAKTGARVIDADKCTGCQLCMQACPQYPNTPIRYDANSKKCVKCDLCGGDPQCVKLCPMSVSWSPSCHPVKDHPLKFVKYGSI